MEKKSMKHVQSRIDYLMFQNLRPEKLSMHRSPQATQAPDRTCVNYGMFLAEPNGSLARLPVLGI